MSENRSAGRLPNWAAIPAGVASVLLGVAVSRFYRLGTVGNVALTLLFMAVIGVTLDRVLDTAN